MPPPASALAGAYTAAKELRYGYKADFGWTDVFHPAHVLAWVGLLFAVLLIVVDGLRPDRPMTTDGTTMNRPATTPMGPPPSPAQSRKRTPYGEYRMMQAMARKPSRQPIFLPSS